MKKKYVESKVTSKLLLDIAFELGKTLNSDNSNNNNYKIVIDTLGERLDWDYGELWLLNHIDNILEKSDITYLSPSCDDLRVLRAFRLNITWHLNEGIPGIAQSEKKALWISNFDSNYPIHKKELIMELKIKSGVAIPVFSEDYVIAVLFFMSKSSKHSDEIQMDFYNLLAGRLGNLLLRIDLEREIIQAKKDLRSSIDLNFSTLNKILMYRDPYTVDHQKKVANIAVRIATDLGYREIDIEDLVIAAQLHDVGKIAIPIEILNKPGHISKEEYALIKTHVETSYDLLSTLPCSDQIKRIIHEHHEREDGSGYPSALKSDELSPLSKILIVSDVISAMLEDRPYRKGLETKLVIDELLKGREIIFDSSCVDIAISYLEELL